MMKQPELGKKIAELRKARGFTQEELVETCHLSVRTLQRIEAGEVSPRSYTLKIIFKALDYPLDLVSMDPKRPGLSVRQTFPWLEQLICKIFNLFNFKTNTMIKISILTLVIAVAILTGVFFSKSSDAQKVNDVEKIITEANQKFFHWFNSGNIDSLMTLYRDDACLLAVTCGKAQIANHYRLQAAMYTFERINNMSVSVSDSIAVEKGQWIIVLSDGKKYLGEYLTEWRETNGTWLIVNDIGTVKAPL